MRRAGIGGGGNRDRDIDRAARTTGLIGQHLPGAGRHKQFGPAFADQITLPRRDRAASGAPGILLVYNNLDPLQRFGTEPHDFLAAMYGDLTLIASREAKRITGPFFGRNQSFREGKNDSFSAVGWLHSESNWVSVHLYENMYAKVSLDYASLPAFISYNRTQEQGEGHA